MAGKQRKKCNNAPDVLLLDFEIPEKWSASGKKDQAALT
jgi:hypothetical protein